MSIVDTEQKYYNKEGRRPNAPVQFRIYKGTIIIVTPPQEADPNIPDFVAVPDIHRGIDYEPRQPKHDQRILHGSSADDRRLSA
jgi:hypothetical protein